MDGVLTKPYTENQLADAIATYRWGSGNLKNKANKSGRDEIIENTEIPTIKSVPDIYPIGDDKKFDEFSQIINIEIKTKLLTNAQNSLQDRMEKLRNGLASSDPDQIREAAHSIKGASGSMYAPRISILASVIEEQPDDFDCINKLMPEFEDAAKDTLEWWAKKMT